MVNIYRLLLLIAITSHICGAEFNMGVLLGSSTNAPIKNYVVSPVLGAMTLEDILAVPTFGLNFSKKVNRYIRLEFGIEFEKYELRGTWDSLSVGEFSVQFYRLEYNYTVLNMESKFEFREVSFPIKLDLYPLRKHGLYFSGGYEFLWLAAHKNKHYYTGVMMHEYDDYLAGDQFVEVKTHTRESSHHELTIRNDVQLGYGVGWEVNIGSVLVSASAYRSIGSNDIFNNSTIRIGKRTKTIFSVMIAATLH